MVATFMLVTQMINQSLPMSHHFFTILTGRSTPVHMVSYTFDPIGDQHLQCIYKISWVQFFVTIILPFDACHTS